MLGEHSTFSQHSKWVFPPVNRNKVRSIAQQLGAPLGAVIERVYARMQFFGLLLGGKIHAERVGEG